MYKVYGDIYSGNCYKVKLLLTQLGIEHAWEPVEVVSGDTRSEQFLAMNPNGKIPLLEFPDGTHLSESGAILWYLAEGSEYLPAERLARARVLQWMFFEQYSHEPYIAVARFMVRYLQQAETHQDILADKQQRGYRALDVMEGHLQTHEFFVDAYSIADIALYAYTHVADEGNMGLRDYPNIRAWLERVAAQSGHITMSQGA
ncbi:MAG: glutathione S-transferase family protein [Gammaproteobacteria bacterium]|nr:glutathione S-transferase family protein [Gammaproteobacteria bacterium]